MEHRVFELRREEGREVWSREDMVHFHSVFLFLMKGEKIPAETAYEQELWKIRVNEGTATEENRRKNCLRREVRIPPITLQVPLRLSINAKT